jgi:hypothetical protein
MRIREVLPPAAAFFFLSLFAWMQSDILTLKQMKCFLLDILKMAFFWSEATRGYEEEEEIKKGLAAGGRTCHAFVLSPGTSPSASRTHAAAAAAAW